MKIIVNVMKGHIFSCSLPEIILKRSEPVASAFQEAYPLMAVVTTFADATTYKNQRYSGGYMSNSAEKRSYIRVMRNLHRDIGFFIIGLTLIYCVSGIVLIYRDKSFLQFANNVETTIAQGLSEKELESVLHLRRMKIIKQEDDKIYFNYGEYDKLTGHVSYTTQEHPWIIQKFNAIHLSPSASMLHFVGVMYGIMLVFLAISSFFMYKSGSTQARRGVIIAAVGVVAAFALMI